MGRLEIVEDAGALAPSVPLFVQYRGEEGPRAAYLYVAPDGESWPVVDDGVTPVPVEGDLLPISAQLSRDAMHTLIGEGIFAKHTVAGRAAVLAHLEAAVARIDPACDVVRVVGLESFVGFIAAGMGPGVSDADLAIDVDTMLRSNREEGAVHTFTRREALDALIVRREQVRDQHFVQWLDGKLRGEPTRS